MTDADAIMEGSLAAVLREANALAEDYGEELARALRLAAAQPLGEDELRELFGKVVVRLRTGRGASREERARVAAEVTAFVEQLVAVHDEDRASTEEYGQLELQDRYGLVVHDVVPAPVFLGETIPLREGFVEVTKLRLWPGNHRLELHMSEFRKRYDRDPTEEELLGILLSRIPFEGVAPRDRLDYFKIQDLADSIAANGVRVPPIIDWTGMPYDGNRRLAACMLILSSKDYDESQRRNAQWIKVWQALPGTTRDQIDNMVVALNFEKDLKQPWPEWVRAKQVFDEFEKARDLALATEKHPDLTHVRREVGRRFGIRTDEVTRYVKMVEWALEFGDYHRGNGRDESEILHRTNKYFQYFYELDSGRGEDKLAAKLDKDDGLKGLVFDLMYDGKIKRFERVRELRKVFADETATEMLIDAATTPDEGVGASKVEQAIAIARRHDIARKQIGAQQRVEEFTRWLETEATQETWRHHVDLDTLRSFLAAVRAVDGTVATVLAERTSDLL